MARPHHPLRRARLWSPRRRLLHALLQSHFLASAQADVVFTMVGAPSDVEEVILGPAGVLAGLKPGGLLIDMTTSTPALAQTVAAWAAVQGVAAVDAPVSGGDVGAQAASLSIMCGGTDEAMARAAPLLRYLGKSVRHMGGPGAGQHTKMCNQVWAVREYLHNETRLLSPFRLPLLPGLTPLPPPSPAPPHPD